VTYDQLNELDNRLLALTNEIVQIRSKILQEKHKIEGPRRAGLHPGQYDNYVDAQDLDESCET
jgi:hypothetical protein